MGDYYGVRMKDDPEGAYLQHWGIAKGATREGHKYLARLVTSSGYRYIYDQAQLAAAKAGRSISNAANAVSRTANQGYRAIRNTARNAGRAIDNAVGISARSNLKRAAENATRTRERAHRASERAVNATARPLNPDTPRPSMAEARIGRMRRNTARRTERAAERSMNEYKKGLNKYSKTLLGRVETGLHKATGKSFDDVRAKDIGNLVGKQANKAYKSARKAASDTYDRARKAVGDTVGNAEKQIKGAQKKIKAYQNFRKMSPVEKAGAVTAESLGVKKAKGAKQAMKIWRMEQAIRNAPGNAARAVSETAEGAYKSAKRTAKKVGRNVENQAQRAVRATSVGRGVDDKYGVTRMGRHNLANSEYKKKSLARAKATRESGGKMQKNSTDAAVRSRKVYNREARAGEYGPNINRDTISGNVYYNDMKFNKEWRNENRKRKKRR